MLAALGVVFLYIGSVVQVMDITMAVVASLCCTFAVIEFGGSYPWLVYAVTGVASLIVLPQKGGGGHIHPVFRLLSHTEGKA